MNADTNTVTTMNAIKQWVHLDDQLRELSQRVTQLRQQKHALEALLHTQSQLQPAIYTVGESKVRWSMARQAEPLTFTYLQRALGEIVKHDGQAKAILDHIRQSRTVKLVPDMKRL